MGAAVRHWVYQPCCTRICRLQLFVVYSNWLSFSFFLHMKAYTLSENGHTPCAHVWVSTHFAAVLLPRYNELRDHGQKGVVIQAGKKSLKSGNLLAGTEVTVLLLRPPSTSPHPWPLGAVASGSRLLLTCALLMTSSHHRAGHIVCGLCAVGHKRQALWSSSTRVDGWAHPYRNPSVSAGE